MSNLKIWRESASLIVAAKTVLHSTKRCDYKVLCLKRSSKSGFMPNNYVFPGGNQSKTDCSSDWLKIFENAGYDSKALKNLCPKYNIPSLFQNNDINFLPKYLSLRICAIRETFEECGLLICKQKDAESDMEWASNIGSKEILSWQQRVHDDPKEFINLCLKYEIYPDLWALKLWSHWVTPPSYATLFNTLFFITTFKEIPETRMDQKEIQDLKWETPETFLEENRGGEIMLPPPQFYEFSRLRNFEDIELLNKHISERAIEGCEKYLPYRVLCQDAIYTILPGDGLYPNEIGQSSEIKKFDKLPETEIKNRLKFAENKFELIVENFTPKAGHLSPKEN